LFKKSEIYTTTRAALTCFGCVFWNFVKEKGSVWQILHNNHSGQRRVPGEEEGMIYSTSFLEQSPEAWFVTIVATSVFTHAFKRFVRQPARDNTSISERAARASIRQKFNQKKEFGSDIDTVVIGSGMGGLSCAAVLARLGKKVLVLEQHNDVAGGGTHQFDLQGYRFDSGLHYTVPWSVPIFALTCGKKESDVCQFDLMGDSFSTVDKIHLHNSLSPSSTVVPPFNMKLHEQHMTDLYAAFPEERKGLDQFMALSDKAMLFVKIFLGMRLFPKWMQNMLWKLVPSSILNVVACTAEEILPTLTSNKRLMSLLSSMWIDTGARPDKASFMMTAAVFRGVSMEGGCYPAKGAEAMAIELANVITSNGGSILVRAKVSEIVVEGGRVTGVKVGRAPTNGHLSSAGASYSNSGVFIRCNRVVSGAGYTNTFDRLVADDVLKTYNIPRSLPVKQSAGFVMANIGKLRTAVH
jgi:all-trans-retinol 13,14-reductase